MVGDPSTRVYKTPHSFIIFIIVVLFVFPFYYYFTFPKVEYILYNYYEVYEIGNNNSNSPFRARVWLPKTISSFAPEVVWIFLNQKPDLQNLNTSTAYRLVIGQGEIKEGVFYAHVYICSEFTNLYQCPDSQRYITISNGEISKIGRLYIILNGIFHPYNINKKEKSEIRLCIKFLSIKEDKGQIQTTEDARGSNAGEDSCPQITVATTLVDILQVLTRAFIYFVLLPPRSNYLLVTLAFFTTWFGLYLIETQKIIKWEYLKDKYWFTDYIRWLLELISSITIVCCILYLLLCVLLAVQNISRCGAVLIGVAVFVVIITGLVYNVKGYNVKDVEYFKRSNA